jgi:hypothetical protein
VATRSESITLLLLSLNATTGQSGSKSSLKSFLSKKSFEECTCIEIRQSGKAEETFLSINFVDIILNPKLHFELT